MKLEKAVIGGDCHFGAEDKKAIELFRLFCKEEKPGTVILNGDLVDAYELSHFLKEPTADGLKSEIESAKSFLKKLRASLPDASLVYVWGNHSQRWDKSILAKMPELFGVISLDELLNCKDLGIKVIKTIQTDAWYEWHDVLIGHWNSATKGAGMTARKLMMEKGTNLIQSHTHRLGATAYRWSNRTTYAYETGCLCSLNPPYVTNPDWQQGFIVGYWDGKNSWCFPVPIKDGRLLYGNSVYS